MATQLVLMNRILRRLREEQVTASTNNEYAQLVAEFVADAYEEIVDEHLWEGLRHVTKVDIVAGTSQYVLDAKVADGGNVRDSDIRVPKECSQLQFIDEDIPQVWLFDDDNDDEPHIMHYLTPEAMRVMQRRDRDNTDAYPYFFAIYNENDATRGRRLLMDVYPEPTAARVMELVFWTKPDLLAADGTTDNVSLLLPERPIYLRALMTAQQERGEELGETQSVQFQKYEEALARAIEGDIAEAQRGGRFEWRRD